LHYLFKLKKTYLNWLSILNPQLIIQIVIKSEMNDYLLRKLVNNISRQKDVVRYCS